MGSKNLPRQSAQLAIASASIVAVVYKIILWRARTRARTIVKQMEEITEVEGPLIGIHDPGIRDVVLERAIRRASTWMTLSLRNARPMIGQVGGASVHKKPVLTLSPDYILKPVRSDHRGFREIAFYEAMEAVAKARANSGQAYANFLRGNTSKAVTPMFSRMGEFLDTLALAVAMVLQDSVVVTSETTLKSLWKSTKREAELLYNLGKFTPSYYGIMGQETPSPEFPFGVTDDAHLLLQDITANYSRPCVMDLKMGTVTYESDAAPDKKQKEYRKYGEQALYGFRIVGMRIYNPDHQDADGSGYQFFGKEYGRNRKTRKQVKEALRIYFGARNGNNTTEEQEEIKSSDSSETETTPPTTTTVNGKSGSATTKNKAPRFRIKSASNIMVQLRSIRRWFEDNSSLLFCASSLLLVYEGSATSPDVPALKMIDFGRVRRNIPGGDPGYLHGLNTLHDLLAEIVTEEEERLGLLRKQRYT